MVVLLMVKKNSMATLCTLNNTFKFVASFFFAKSKNLQRWVRARENISLFPQGQRHHKSMINLGGSKATHFFKVLHKDEFLLQKLI